MKLATNPDIRPHLMRERGRPRNALVWLVTKYPSSSESWQAKAIARSKSNGEAVLRTWAVFGCGTLMEALALFNQPETWRQIMQNGMATDFSWKSSALEYLELYEKVLAEKQRAEVIGQKTDDRRQLK